MFFKVLEVFSRGRMIILNECLFIQFYVFDVVLGIVDREFRMKFLFLWNLE